MVVLSPHGKCPTRRVVFLDNPGGAAIWAKIKNQLFPPHHLRVCPVTRSDGLRGCLSGTITRFLPLQKPIQIHSLSLLDSRSGSARMGLSIVGISHWIPSFAPAGWYSLSRCVPILSPANRLKPELRSIERYYCADPAAAEQAKKLAPKAKVAHLGWGADLSVFPKLPYRPESFFSCGIALVSLRRTLSNRGPSAAALIRQSISVICPGIPEGITWSYTM